MLLQIYSVYDVAIEAYGIPWMCRATGEAIRQFSDLVNSSDGNPYAKHPEQYWLYHFGSFDDHSGEFNLSGGRRKLVSGSEQVIQRTVV